MNSFCTIITSSHLPFAKALYRSLQMQDTTVQLQVLVTDSTITTAVPFTIHTLDTVLISPVAKKLYDQYAVKDPDAFRWALKPVFMNYLLEHGFDKVIFCDADLFFTSNYEFLWKELDANNFLLSPHFTDALPEKDEEIFLMSFRIGQFNAGFVGANKNAKPILNWWAAVCAYKIEKQEQIGLFDDQRYLDAVPVLFDSAKIITHRGCNLGSWNINNNKRSLINGQVLINEQFPVVFIHFNYETIQQILNGNDALLKPYWEDYKKLFDGDLGNLIPSLQQWKTTGGFFSQVKQRTKLRTRIKHFFYQLSQKL